MIGRKLRIAIVALGASLSLFAARMPQRQSTFKLIPPHSKHSPKWCSQPPHSEKQEYG